MARRKRPSEGGPARGSVYPLLDLHGHTGDEARRAAERWLRARQSSGERTVVVVTGRGNRSSGPPVLRAEIEHLLESLSSVVDAFDLVDGGGAFRVTLRRQASPPQRRDPGAAALRDVDPSLLRRAEEALWELGIAPTPALLRVEVRRILEEESDGERDP
jgi:hypothetical protein